MSRVGAMHDLMNVVLLNELIWSSSSSRRPYLLGVWQGLDLEVAVGLKMNDVSNK